LKKENRLQFVDNQQDVNIFEKIKIHYTQGHTEAMMMPMIEIDGKTVVFCADSLAASYFVPMPYVMSYDIRPMDTLAEKEWLLSEAAAKNWILFFEHDPVVEAATIVKTESGKFIIDRSGTLEELLSQ
jgi:glyoxylase-like metal-dependent hydrolase (beta-lactamase superfamily II)